MGVHSGHSFRPHRAGSKEKALTGKRVIQMCGIITGVDDPLRTRDRIVSPFPWSPSSAGLSEAVIWRDREK